jgi:hypothetical protein
MGRGGGMESGLSGGMAPGRGGEGPESDEGFGGDGFMEGGFMGEGQAGGTPEKTIERTDFEIHVVWKRKTPEEPKK